MSTSAQETLQQHGIRGPRGTRVVHMMIKEESKAEGGEA